MLEGKTSDFKTLTLLRVIKRLIENTESYGIYKLENILSKKASLIPIPVPIAVRPRRDLEKEREQKLSMQKSQIKEDIKNKLNMTPSVKIVEDSTWAPPVEELNPAVPEKRVPAPRKSQSARPQPSSSRLMSVPGRERIDDKDYLPPHLRYLKPTPILKRVGMDLGELNPYLLDPNVDSIEVEGENERVYVVGSMGKKPISLVLDRDEIEAIIDKFSVAAKIPKVEGLFKVSVNNLILTAMVSNVISSRFIIKKIRI